MARLVRPPGGVGVISGEFDLGTYGVLGGEIELFGNWVPGSTDPRTAADDMLQLAGYLENTEAPLIAAAQIAEHDTQERFDTETDPDGREWISLDPDYAAHKHEQGFTGEGSSPSGDYILRLTNRMMKAATSKGAWIVHSDTLVFDPSGLPFYAYMHQVGSGTENVGDARDHRELVRAERESGVKTAKGRGGQKSDLNIGRGKALPARPFIGLSNEAINEITELFDLWFDEGQDQFFANPMTGSVQKWQFRGNVRLFGPKV